MIGGFRLSIKAGKIIQAYIKWHAINEDEDKGDL